jgi:tetratricopeptide (TPR) repeat protein
MKDEKSTVALAMIIKDELDSVIDIIEQAYPYFDELIFTVSDHPTYKKLKEQTRNMLKPEVDYREWNNRFDEARNHNFSLVNSTYVFWCDADDEFDFSRIPELVAIADEGNFDQIMLPYNYAQDDQGNTVAYHWRERLIRRSHPFTWKGWIHETPVTNKPYRAHRVNIPVKHIAEPGHVKDSLERNHAILLEAIKESDDPRYQMYLGSSHHARGEYGEALQVLDAFNKVSGNPEDIYRSLGTMAECAFMLGRPTAAINYSLQQAALIPEYPQAYYLLAHWEAEQENWPEALEWVKTSETKEDAHGMGVYDPSARTRARLIAAESEFMLRNYNEALKWLRMVDPKNPARQELEESFVNEADAETFVSLLPKFRKFFESDKLLFEALCYDLRYDKRLRGLREVVEPPKTWDNKSIVILCGPGYEEWGPHTLDKGMGGSEEAVVYLSRALAEQGWNVTVYGAVTDTLWDVKDGKEWHVNDTPWLTDEPTVVYHPSQEFNPNDKFNVFVAWRAPEFTEHVTAKVKLADIHDVLGNDRMRNYDDVTYFVKSQYHKNLYPHIDDNKFRVIGNGISKKQFKDENEDNTN